MSQRAALTRLYNGLAIAEGRVGFVERRALVDQLETGSDEIRLVDEQRIGLTTEQLTGGPGLLDAFYADAFAELADRGDGDVDSDGPAADLDGDGLPDPRRPVLSVEIVEFLLTLSARLRTQRDPVPTPLTKAVDVEVPEVMSLITQIKQDGTDLHDVARRLDAEAARSRTLTDFQGEPQGASSADAISSLEAEGVIAISSPGVECIAAVVAVEVDAQGEYATYIETNLTYPDLGKNYSEADIRTAVLDPLKWPSAHEFWTAMEPAAGAPFGLIAAHEAGVPEATDHHAALCTGRLLWERVGDRPRKNLDPNERFRKQTDDWFPATVLCFNDPIVEASNVLRYHVVSQPFIEPIEDLAPDRLTRLAIDDGAVTLRFDGDAVHIRTTKTLHIRQTLHQQQGQVLAEFACESGWVTNTRHLIENLLV